MRFSAIVAVAGIGVAAAFVGCADDAAEIPAAADAGTSSTSSSSSSSSSASSSSSGEAVVDGGSASCAAEAKAICEKSFRCDYGRALVVSGDMATCVANEEASCERATKMAGVAAVPASCAATASSCDEDVFGADPACWLRGTLGVGTACEVDRQCASGLCAREGACGICEAVTWRKRGEACVTGVCVRGSLCRDGVCKPYPQKDEGCSGAGDCAWPLRCAEGKCVEPGAPGAPCTTTDECDFKRKSEGCVGAKCALALPVATDASCLDTTTGEALSCYGSDHCLADVCRKRGPAGANCAASSNACRPYELCNDAAKCAPKPPDLCK